MKKKGSTLVTVLVIFTALIIIATAISSAVINTNKLNKRYSDTIDLELAAKSGINIVKDDFISKVKNKEIKSLDKVKEYISKVNNPSWVDSEGIKNFFKEYSDNNIDLDVALSLELKDDKNILKITSTAENKGIVSVEKIEEQSLILNINEGGSGEGDTGGTNTDESEKDYDLSIFKNYINVSNDIKIGVNNQNISYTKNSAYGNSSYVGNNSSGYNPKYEPSLKNMSISINQNEIDNIINKFNNEIESLNTSSNIEIKDKEYVKYRGLNTDNKYVTINNSKVMFSGDSNFTNLNTFSSIINSTIVFDGDFISNDKINMPIIENSIIIVRGTLKVQNGISMNKFNNSMLVITEDLNISATSGYTINLINSNIVVGNSVYSTNGLNINLDNSIFIAKNNFNFGNGLKGSSNNSSLICGGDMYIQNVNDNFICSGKTYPENIDVLRKFYKYVLVL